MPEDRKEKKGVVSKKILPKLKSSFQFLQEPKISLLENTGGMPPMFYGQPTCCLLMGEGTGLARFEVGDVDVPQIDCVDNIV